MIAHTLPLEDINRGFDLMRAGGSLRSVAALYATGEAFRLRLSRQKT